MAGVELECTSPGVLPKIPYCLQPGMAELHPSQKGFTLSCKKPFQPERMNLLPRQESLRLLHSHIANPRMIQHCLASEAVMRVLARHFGENEEQWAQEIGRAHV